jgi:PKD repeat protein
MSIYTSSYIFISLIAVVKSYMRISNNLLISASTAAALVTAACLAIVFANPLTTMANAQVEEQQLPSNQTASIQNGTLFESTTDNFRVQLPEGWIVHDVDNTGPTLESEVLQGYGILAQLCPEEHQQATPAIGGSDSNSTASSTCQGSEGNIVHVLRYPNLSNTVGFTSDDVVNDYDNTMNAILSYEIEKLQEVGYQDIQVVNSTDTAINVDISTPALYMVDNDITNALPPSVAIPAKIVKMTYTTTSAPDETRTGIYLLTSTAATSSNPGMVTGYAIFHESDSTVATETTTPSESPAPTPIPESAIQVFGSFELIASDEMVQALVAALAAQLDQAQLLGQLQQIVTIRTIQTGVFGESVTPLAGSLTASGTRGVAPATFEFGTDLRGGAPPYTINWDFGDGSQESNRESVVHTFDEPGTYTVTMTVIDSVGQAGSARVGITVEEGLVGEQPPAEGNATGNNQNNTSTEEGTDETDSDESTDETGNNQNNTSTEEGTDETDSDESTDETDSDESTDETDSDESTDETDSDESTDETGNNQNNTSTEEGSTP